VSVDPCETAEEKNIKAGKCAKQQKMRGPKRLPDSSKPCLGYLDARKRKEKPTWRQSTTPTAGPSASFKSVPEDEFDGSSRSGSDEGTTDDQSFSDARSEVAPSDSISQVSYRYRSRNSQQLVHRPRSSSSRSFEKLGRSETHSRSLARSGHSESDYTVSQYSKPGTIRQTERSSRASGSPINSALIRYSEPDIRQQPLVTSRSSRSGSTPARRSNNKRYPRTEAKAQAPRAASYQRSQSEKRQGPDSDARHSGHGGTSSNRVMKYDHGPGSEYDGSVYSNDSACTLVPRNLRANESAESLVQRTPSSGDKHRNNR